MSRPAPRPFSLALEGLTSALAPATTLAQVQQTWEQAVGPQVAAAGLPTAERDGVLTVTCSDAVWSAELELMGQDLVERVNRELGETLIKKLRCRSC
ncbi:MAG: DciA family protein [Solirubrobacteraceae bacterium]